MGNVLSYKEQKALKPHLQGIEPASLAAIIWDSINLVGVDDDLEKIGIHFINESELDDSSQSQVIFWDENGATDMPRKVFLEVLLMIGEQIVNEYESNYDLEKATDLGTAVNKLQLALVSLNETIQSLPDEGSKTYRERLDSGVLTSDEHISDNLIEKVRTRRGSYMWTNGETENLPTNVGRRRSKGIEGVIDRLPELRRRYDKAIGGSNNSLDRVRSKIKILTMFQKGSVAPTAILEEDEGYTQPSPSLHRKSTLSVQEDGMSMTTSSSMLHPSRSRSSSICSYESVSSNKQLLHTDSPRGTTSRAPTSSLPNIQRSRRSIHQL